MCSREINAFQSSTLLSLSVFGRFLGSEMTSSIMSKRWVLKQAFDGLPKREDFVLVEENLRSLQDGQITIDTLFLSVDPYMRKMFEPLEENYVNSQLKPPYTMNGMSVGKVIASKNDHFQVGDLVTSNAGWISVANINPEEKVKNVQKLLAIKVSN